MKTSTKFIIAGVIITIVLLLFPSIRFSAIRVRDKINDKLNSEFVVDNYKQKYVELNDKKCQIQKHLQKFQIDKKVATKKREYVENRSIVTKQKLIECDTTDLKKFNVLKTEYETLQNEVTNYDIILNSYDMAIKKLEDSLNMINANMSKAKANISTLESKKIIAESIKSVNNTIETITGVNDTDELNVTIEKLDTDVLQETIKMEVLKENSDSLDYNNITSVEDAKKYIENISGN